MNLKSDDISKWGESLDDFKPEYFPIPCSSLLQFYTLKGRTSTICRDNIEVIRYLQYAVYSPTDKRFYMRLFRPYDLETLYFYRPSLTFSGEDEAVKNLRKYVQDGNVTLLFTQDQVSNTTNLLERLWRANLEGDGKLPYGIYLKLLHERLQLEDYETHGKNLTGYRTVCKQFNDRIAELWKKAYETKKEDNEKEKVISKD